MKNTLTPELLQQTPREVCEFIDQILARLNKLERRVEELEQRNHELETRLANCKCQQKLTPQNSSLPPSSQHPHQKPVTEKKSSGKKRGGQPGHDKHARALVPLAECGEVISLKPTNCRKCGSLLSGDDESPLRHQVYEMPEIKPIIKEYQQHRLICSCGCSTCAELPAGVPTGQSGPRLIAFASLLMLFFRQSKRRTKLFLEEVLHIPCSTGLTIKYQQFTQSALKPCYEELRAAISKAAIIHFDETAMKQATDKSWLWVAVTNVCTLFMIRLTRSATVVHELLGEDYQGLIICDRYGGYEQYHRQLCWAHLKRDFQGLIDIGSGAKVVGERLMGVTKELFHQWHCYLDGTINFRTLKQLIEPLKWKLWEALEDGRHLTHDKTAGKCAHIFARFDHLWRFAEKLGVEPTNNAAERALRPAVIWRKLSFGTQSNQGSRFVETLLSVIETCRQQKKNVFEFVTNCVNAKMNQQTTPKLLSRA